ncbi:MAG TPA: PEP-CTERM sorting domain-containing protein [Roseiarcus sp.]
MSTAKTSFAGVSVVSTAATGSSFLYGTSSAAAAGGSEAQSLAMTDGPYAVSAVLPDGAYAANLIDGASSVAAALLGPRGIVFGTAILEGGSATFDFAYRGDLLLGLIDVGPLDVIANGVEIFDSTTSADSIIDLGSQWGPDIDLTFIGDGKLAFGGVVPEPSTWAMMLVGFAGLGFLGYRTSFKTAVA